MSKKQSSTPHDALRHCRNANHLDAGYKTLPMVVPLLFYHGIESSYPYSLCWLDCFADPNLARQLYASAFPLIDVTLMPDDEIMLHRRMALLELIQNIFVNAT